MELIIVGSIIGFLIIATAVLIPIVKVIAPIFPYAYTNARLRAMRKELLSKEDFEELLKKPYNEIIYSLAKKNYPDLSNYLEADFSYASVENALRTSLIKTLGKIKTISPQQSQKYLKAQLAKYDVQLIESMVRTSHAKQRIRRDIFHVTEVFTENFVNREHHTIDDLYNELKYTIYEPLLAKHLENLKKGIYHEFETELDLQWLKRLLSTAKTPEARSYTKYLLDRHNISLMLKGITPSIPGGRIPLEAYQNITTAQDVANLCRKHNIEVAADTPEGIEKALQERLRRMGHKMLSKNPLSEASIIGYFILKTTDIRALNILLKMKHDGFDEEAIKEVIVT